MYTDNIAVAVAVSQHRRNQLPFFREQTLLLYVLQMALAVAHTNLYKVRVRLRLKDGKQTGATHGCV